MATKELKKYIKDASIAGLDEYQIILNLLNAGWQEEDIDIAIKEVFPEEGIPIKKQKKSKSLNSRTFISYILILFGFAFIFLALYMSRSYITEAYKYFIPDKNTASVVARSKIQVKIKQSTTPSSSTLLFVGDIMLSKNRGTGKQIIKNNDARYPFLRIAKTLRSADLAFGNLEGPISSRGKDMGSKYSFRDSPKVVGGLKFAGFDVLSVANNHIFDWGYKAFDDTLLILKANGIEPVGGGLNYQEANLPVIKNINGVKVAFLAYSMVDYDTNVFNAVKSSSGRSSFNLEKTQKIIEKIKKWGLANIVVVSFHWGEEYKTRSNSKQQNIAHSLVNAGADLIIGHHPHVVQELERYKKGWIAYSLGNFVFDQNFSKETMKGLMLKVKINNKTKKITKVQPIDIGISDTFQPYVE